VIQHRLLDRLALEMLEGNIRDGDSVLVDLENGDLTFKVTRRAQVQAEAGAVA
jgi:ATP-dependent Clp protease ATP-binding subunit ClpA